LLVNQPLVLSLVGTAQQAQPLRPPTTQTPPRNHRLYQELPSPSTTHNCEALLQGYTRRWLSHKSAQHNEYGNGCTSQHARCCMICQHVCPLTKDAKRKPVYI